MAVYTFEEISDKVRPIAEKYQLRNVWLFGSYARGDANEDSDIDLLVDADNVHGFQFFGMYDELCTALEKEVDMVTVNTIKDLRESPIDEKFVQNVELDRRRII